METVASKVGAEKENQLIQLTLNDYLQGRPIKDIERLHVQLTFATFRFIDRFNLIKLDGKWLIVDKVSYRQEPL